MGLFIPSKRATPRRFEYEPRFYDPSRDETLRQRMRLGRKARKRNSPTRALYIGAILALALYLFHSLG